MARYNDILVKLPRTVIVTFSLAFVLALAAAEYLSGPDISLVVFYILPVFIATWYAGNLSGMFISFISAISWSIDNMTKSYGSGTVMIPYWDIAMQFIFLVFIVRVLSALKISFEKERELAREDYLTKVANARSFYEIAEVEIDRLRRYKHPFTLAYLDVDNFKLVNDRMGHSVGDHLLSDIARMMEKSVRAVDTVARLGGDEFAILMPETSQEGAQAVIARLRANIGDAAKKSGWPVTVSIGVVTCQDSVCALDELIKKADALMYSAKTGGKNAVRAETLKSAV
jgi:diguanylate cyclase (GGDEF)-like protein